MNIYNDGAPVEEDGEKTGRFGNGGILLILWYTGADVRSQTSAKWIPSAPEELRKAKCG